MRLSEQAALRVQQMAAIGYWELDLKDIRNLNANELRWSDGTFLIFGYRPGEVGVTNDLFVSAVVEEDRPKIADALADALRSGKPYIVEHRILRKDGSLRYVREHADIVKEERTGRPLMLFGTVQDVTWRVEAEAALREREGRFRATFYQAAVGMAHVGLDGRWIRVNQKMCDIVGYSREELARINFQCITHPEDLAADLSRVKDLLDGKIDSYSLEKRYIHKNQSIVWINLTVSLVRSPSGEPQYFVSVVENITERHRAQEALKAINAELDQRVQARTKQLADALKEVETFSYTVSHDLRAPLRHIDAFAAMVEEDASGALPEHSRELLERIKRNVGKLHKLIDGLLVFALASKAMLTRNSFDLRDVVEDVIEELASDSKGRRIQWKVRNLPSLKADRTLIRQVIYNLLANAVKYTRYQENAVIEIAGSQSGWEAVVSVRDNGVGFERELAGQLFTPFHRLHSNAEFEGSGIGLASVRRIIERHGGRVWAEGSAGSGATFYFSLPDSPPF